MRRGTILKFTGKCSEPLETPKKTKMKKYLSTAILLSTLVSFIATHGQSHKPAIDYLKLGSVIVFEDQSYQLAWTSHPSNNFYKQEYIPKGDDITKFKKMMLIDLIVGNHDIRDVVTAKVMELKKLREINPIVNYEILENPTNGEYILDFLLSENSADGNSIMVAERNVYRYRVFKDQSGNKGILLFGISTRSYGQQIDKFLAGLKSSRKELISSVSQFAIPEVSFSDNVRL